MLICTNALGIRQPLRTSNKLISFCKQNFYVNIIQRVDEYIIPEMFVIKIFYLLANFRFENLLFKTNEYLVFEN